MCLSPTHSKASVVPWIDVGDVSRRLLECGDQIVDCHALAEIRIDEACLHETVVTDHEGRGDRQRPASLPWKAGMSCIGDSSPWISAPSQIARFSDSAKPLSRSVSSGKGAAESV